jgi:outer membrane cobalamin receptor
MRVAKGFMLIVGLILIPGLLLANGTITGKVTDKQSGEPLAGANILVVGTSLGDASDAEGNYTIHNVPDGTHKVKASFIGFDLEEQEVMISSGSTATVNFELAQGTILSEGVYVTSSRARDRETPVAFTNIEKARIQKSLGSRDIPLVLNTTPSVYATPQGGGAGDARINVRGFNQRNIAIMINGVPVNDMENGWVYWSNWDGVGDATSSIQIQRGLSAVNLATPSIGGTMNILTDPTALASGGLIKQEFGTGSFIKSTVLYNTGLINDKYALTAALIKKSGDGLVDAAWTDAYAFYVAGSYNINQNNRIDLYAIGAPQRHGQNLYRQNIAVYNQEFARNLDSYDPAAFEKYHEAGQKYNQNWAPVSESYTGQQYLGNLGNSLFLFGSSLDNRYNSYFINERENFFHKPQVNLNWYSQLSNQVGLFSVFYWSGGTGGGTGTLGSLVRAPFDPNQGVPWFNSAPWRWDWDATIERNRNNADGSRGILRNSRNNQWTLGAISKLNYKASDELKLTAGVDWRKAEIDHYREVRDLLGGAYFRSKANDAWDENEQKRGLGDKVNYDFTNTVDWFGTFGQGEYSNGIVSLYGMGGVSFIKYSFTDHFAHDAAGNEVFTESDRITGYQIKGGANYNVSSNVNFYGNIGLISKVPIFDNVISDRDGSRAENPQDEKFFSYEAGFKYRSPARTFTLRANLYYTKWNDRAFSRNVTNPDGSEGLIFLSGMNALHKGVEFEAAFQPTRFFRLDGAASIGDWKQTDDVAGLYKDYGDEGGVNDVSYNFYVKDLKIGDAPQTQIAIGGSVFPTRGMEAQLVVRHYRDHYADWDPFSRTNPEDRVQSWQAPNYTVVDLHASYDLPINIGVIKPTVFLNVFNLFDTLYIQDAVDNSRFSAWDKDHDADDAEVFFGLQRFFNLGFTLNFR